MRKLSILCLFVGVLASGSAESGVRVLHSHVTGPNGPRAGLISDGFGNLYGTTEYGGDGGQGNVFKLRPDGTGFQVLHSFLPNLTDGMNPRGTLVLDGAGNLYGTTARGGEGAGTVFTLRTDGSGYRVLRPFSGPAVLELLPSLTLDQSGNLYGMTSGLDGAGSLFKMKTDGSGFTTLHTFGFGFDDSYGPGSGLALAPSGDLYGTTWSGGPLGGGSVFGIRTDGSGFRVLHAFAGGSSGGSAPNSNLVLDGYGKIFGTTNAGGDAGTGVVFSVTTDGTGFVLVHDFAAGSAPGGAAGMSLALDSGVLYGTSEPVSWMPGDGSVFRMGADGTGFAVLHSFSTLQSWVSGPHGPLLRLGPDTLVGSTVRDGANGAGTIFSLRTDGTAFNTLYDFPGYTADGLEPVAALIADGSGNLYGTTLSPGVVFTLRTDGTGYRLLHVFAGGAADGSGPSAALILDAAGNLYGTTREGGPSNSGTVFTLRMDGTQFQILHAFSGGDGESPEASLTLDSGGILYGTTRYGGSGPSLGTIFALKTDGSAFRSLRSLSVQDGGWPRAGLVQDPAGRLYGTTSAYGRGAGTVFSVLPDGTGFRVLHDFIDVGADGQSPAASLFLDGSGNLFGTTPRGANAANPLLGGDGTVYTLRTDGTGYRVLHAFTGEDGAYPFAPLVQDPWGNLYGTTSQLGGIFTLQPDGSGFRVLHAFLGDPSGPNLPMAGLVRDSAGDLFGTTSRGGSAGEGTEYVLQDLCSAAPDIKVVTGSNPTCFGSSVTLDAGDGFSSYLWSTGATTRTITVSPSAATTYSVVGVVAGCPGPNPAGSLTVTVSSAIPAPPVPTNDGPKCEGDTLQLSLDILPGVTYSWTGPNGFTSSQPVPVIPYPKPYDSGDYLVTSTVAGCTSAAGRTTVVINARPSKPVLTVPATVQSGETFTASVPAAAGVGFNWYVSNATILSGNGTNAVVLQAGRSRQIGIFIDAFQVATGCHSYFGTSGYVTVQLSSSFHTLPPCRLFDTRETNGPAAAAPVLAPLGQRVFNVSGRCGVPGTALALSANVTATGAQADGGLDVAAGYGGANTSVVAFGAGQTRANNAIIALGPGGSIVVWNHSNGTVHFVLDVNGYFE